MSVTIEEAIFDAMADDEQEGRTTNLSWVYRFVQARVVDELTRLQNENRIVYRPGFNPDVWRTDGPVAKAMKEGR